MSEPIEVDLSSDGAPVRFIWRSVWYGVTSAPEPWLGRTAWWHSAARAPRGGGVPLEREMWRVDAVPLQGTRVRLDGSFDLTRLPDGSWQLAEAWDDELEMRLFA
ncbi:DUF6504 family protein [Gulosibacter molinativorax]|uniref:DUF6504 family protein n=1 Tax=Gulosibacter molinativorax TaxID=256821 RepID=UPI003D2F9BFC